MWVMQCGKCAAELQGARKFCARCGAPVPREVDPFASTARPAVVIQEAPKPSVRNKVVSPLATSGIDFDESVRDLIVSKEAAAQSSQPQSSQPSGRQGTVVLQQVPPPAPSAPAMRSSTPVPSAMPASIPFVQALGPGTPVQVRWSNGQKYLGTVWQVHGTQVLVAFPDGQRHWVDQSYVERG